MKDVKWMLRRLRAMSLSELAWRVKEKALTRREKAEFYAKELPVTQIPLPGELAALHPDAARVHMNWQNTECTLYKDMCMFGLYREADWRCQWNAGFQTGNSWPTDVYSPQLSIGQRAEIGDIRTNWELNRHYQFAMLAKSYYVSGDESFLQELQRQFADWNRTALFLHGAQWTSAMELAIRASNWIYTWCFVQQGAVRWHKAGLEPLLEELSHGILNMTAYIVRHRAHGSSANNHLIVELYAVGMAGILYDFPQWKQLAVENLSRELVRQNTADGVNREMSTHYQAFVMEAYGLLAHHLGPEGTPQSWHKRLEPMAQFLQDCCGECGETAVFGDDDSGKILDLCGQKLNYYQYVLQLVSGMCGKCYGSGPLCETLCWLYTPEQQAELAQKTMYQSPFFNARKEGGYTLLRSADRRLLAALDHAPLGFGSIAAHGHADALSFQLWLDGRCLLTDPGTWNYHLSKELRDHFRSTAWHNTVCVDGKDQSEMLGPFLWGKRAETQLLQAEQSGQQTAVTACTQYGAVHHTRCLRFDADRTLWVEDTLTGTDGAAQVCQSFALPPDAQLQREQNRCTVRVGTAEFCLTAESGQSWQTEEYWYSPQYGHRQQAVRIICCQPGGREVTFRTQILIEK